MLTILTFYFVAHKPSRINYIILILATSLSKFALVIGSNKLMQTCKLIESLLENRANSIQYIQHSCTCKCGCNNTPAVGRLTVNNFSVRPKWFYLHCNFIWGEIIASLLPFFNVSIHIALDAVYVLQNDQFLYTVTENIRMPKYPIQQHLLQLQLLCVLELYPREIYLSYNQ